MTPREKYIDIFVNLFDVDKKELNADFTFKNIEKWDSLLHLTLISDLEAAFNIMFDTDDIVHFGSFENGVKILEKYGIVFEK